MARPQFKRALSCLLASLLLGIIAISPAAASKKGHRLSSALVKEYAGRLLVGMEIELKGWSLQRLFRDFDFDGYQQKYPGVVRRLPVAMIDHYLENPANFDHLPTELKARLSKDLKHLNAVKIEMQKPPPATGGGLILSTSDGAPAMRARPLVPAAIHNPRPEGVIIAHDAPSEVPRDLRRPEQAGPKTNAPKMIKEGELFVPDNNTLLQKDWGEVRSRWKNLPIEERRAVVRLSGLERADLETLILTRDEAPIVVVKELQLKADLPENTRKIYDNLEWERDGGSVEFRHKTPLSDPNAYLDQVESFAERVGIRERLDVPTEGLLESYHSHVSIKGAGDITNRAKADNVIRMLEGLDAGFVGVLDANVVSYNSVSRKGLSRVISEDHSETRFHLKSPAMELENTVRVLGEEGYVYTRLERVLAEKLDEKNLSLIIRAGETDKFRLLMFDLVDLEPYLQNSKGLLERMTRMLPNVLEGLDARLRTQLLSGFALNLSKHAKWAAGVADGLDALSDAGYLPEFMTWVHRSQLGQYSNGELLLARALELGSEEVRADVFRQLRIRPRIWSGPLWTRMLELHETGADATRLAIEDLMSSQQAWPDYAVTRVLRSGHPEAALEMLRRYPVHVDQHLEDLKKVYEAKRSANVRDRQLEKWVLNAENPDSCVRGGVGRLLRSLGAKGSH